MQQSSGWRQMRRTSRWNALAAVLSSSAIALPASSAEDPVVGATEVAQAGSATAAVVLRPRWIEPRRAEGVAASDESTADAPERGESARDWRNDSRIVVHAPARQAGTAASVEAMLDQLGATNLRLRTVRTSSPVNQVRFFHAGDAAMARELAAQLMPSFGEVQVNDLTFYRPLPAPGALEVWLP